jgi:carboxymethylenebutenolidase
MKNNSVDPKVLELYDDFCHGSMSRREFLNRASAMTLVGGASALVMAQALLPNYAKAQTISFTDERIKANYVTYPSPGGSGLTMRGYLVQPKGNGPFPSVLVVHENRGLNPYIEDVARRLATDGFLALAPDALTSLGGYPGNDEDGKTMQASLIKDKIYKDMVNSARFLRSHKLSNSKLGVTGFCFGGAVAGYLACELGNELLVSVPFYGSAPETANIKNMKASLLVHYAENDLRVNASRQEFEAALKLNKIKYEMFSYPGTEHGFHNNSTPRYNEPAAKLAWDRTVAAFKKHLA